MTDYENRTNDDERNELSAAISTQQITLASFVCWVGWHCSDNRIARFYPFEAQ